MVPKFWKGEDKNINPDPSLLDITKHFKFVDKVNYNKIMFLYRIFEIN